MITLQQLGLAYRKAKVDIYYSSHPCLEEIADYEQDLHQNLARLLARINANDESWIGKEDFLGTWTLVAKSVDMSEWDSYRRTYGNGFIFSSPAEEWENICSLLAAQAAPAKPRAEFRVMAQCSLDFHVLSTLWMMEVGHLFDGKLASCAYGNRLRRTEDGRHLNELSLGSFAPYLKPFRDWRDKGIQAMRSALDSGRKIVAITADVSSFYHELNPGFLMDPGFISEVVGLELTETQAKLHRLFINGLQAWAMNTPLKKGLPVGLPAAAVVANVALLELDRVLERQVVPLYYGRYVDDIMLVIENSANFRSKAELWSWLFARSDNVLGWTDDRRNEIAFQPAYFVRGEGRSQIHFANTKNKVFMLTGEPGRALVDAIVRQIHERASEWRAMPRLPKAPGDVGTELLAATQSDGEAADNLRKADALTMRRAGFAIKLRDLEAYERDLLPDAWKEHRHAFFRAFIQHVIVLPQFFDLALYLPRVIRLATACEDFRYLRKMFDALSRLCDQVRSDCVVKIKACRDENLPPSDEIIEIWKNKLGAMLCENVAAAFPPRLTKLAKLEWQKYMLAGPPVVNPPTFLAIKNLQAQHARLFSFDLAHMPFRFIALPKEMISQRGIPRKGTIHTCSEAESLLPDSIISGIRVLAEWKGLKGLASGLLFATRPMSLPELFILNRDAYTERGLATTGAVVLAVRGFRLSGSPCFDRKNVLHISETKVTGKCGIAVSSWRTDLASWAAAATRQPDPDVDRYARLNRLLDSVIAEPQHSRYLILPELALPVHWFIRIARKLQGRGISLITGVEYLHAGKSRVRNQVWAALSHDGLGFSSIMIYRQDKQRPALHEESELYRVAGVELEPEKRWRSPPILQHGDFRFALLVCSELTNIGYRADLRGAVDALFVPEWNQDTETFNALVESAALDVHAYIVQCNDRQYGDSRIRGPFKDSWKRDVLRVKGGITDYCVIGQIDIHALRQFQSSHRSPGKPFKPVPDGFEIGHERRVLPSGPAEQ
ncbi:Reverse transcriptase [Ensifer adhaerens]|uniref:Reverse transcriptase n=1 Tax=Ensifer adhaerens TaxID=106592 RepID=UPI003F8717CF